LQSIGNILKLDQSYISVIYQGVHIGYLGAFDLSMKNKTFNIVGKMYGGAEIPGNLKQSEKDSLYVLKLV
jgi:hypothetical protein